MNRPRVWPRAPYEPADRLQFGTTQRGVYPVVSGGGADKLIRDLPNLSESSETHSDADSLVLYDPVDASVWDRFLGDAPGGHHVQSSAWAQVKAHLGWESARVELHRGGNIVGGFQMLQRRVPIVGAFGYVPKGPVLLPSAQDQLPVLMDALHEVARRDRVRYVIVQPPDNGQSTANHLAQSGFSKSRFGAFPVATTDVDLRPPVDEILAGMKSKTRYNIRKSGRNGLVVREGDGTDLPTFHRLLMATADRQGFDDYSLDYFQEMLEQLGPPGHSQLFMAEDDGEPVSALLTIPFGRSVLFKKGGWSGEKGHLFPNEAMHWTAMQWAKSKGYEWYDFEGIDKDAVRATENGQPLPPDLVSSVSRFKIGFGGRVHLVPEPYEYIYNPVARWLHQRVIGPLAETEMVARILKFLKTR